MVDKKDVDLYIKMEQRHAKDVENAYKLGQMDVLEKLKKEMSDLDIESTNGNSAKQVFLLTKDLMISVVENHISELKGEKE